MIAQHYCMPHTTNDACVATRTNFKFSFDVVFLWYIFHIYFCNLLISLEWIQCFAIGELPDSYVITLRFLKELNCFHLILWKDLKQ